MAQLSIRQCSHLCYRLGTAHKAGVDVLRLLQRESQQGTPAYRRHMAHVASQIGTGMTLAEALKDCGGYFPPLTCELVDVGEQTGRLETVLLRLAEHYQHLLRLRRAFLLGILWPALQLAGAVFVIGLLILLLGMLGTSSSVFGLSGTRGLMTFATWVLGIIAVVVLCGYGLRQGWLGPLPRHLAHRVPGVGKALTTMSLARFSWTLSIALESGIDAARSIGLALHSTQNPYFTRHVSDVQAVILRGGQIHEALDRSGAFPKDFLHALQNAELSGTESESLSRLSDEYQHQAEAATTALTIIASLIIWGLVAALIVFLIFYVFMDLYMKPYQEAFEFLENP